MNQTAPVYKHSGKLGIGLFVVPIGVVAALFLSLVYSYINVYSPIAGVITFLVLLGYAFLLGLAVSAACIHTMCRNAGFAHLVGFLVGLFAGYAQWVVFAYALLSRYSDESLNVSLVSLFFEPALLWDFILQINAVGWYSILGSTPSGLALWIFWSVEALTIVLGATLAAGLNVHERVFCEQSGEWCRAEKDVLRVLPKPNADHTRLLAGDVRALGEMELAPEDANAYFRVDLNISKIPEGTCTWEVQSVVINEADGGKAEEAATITPRFLMTGEQHRLLKSYAERLPGEKEDDAAIEEPLPEPTDEEV